MTITGTCFDKVNNGTSNFKRTANIAKRSDRSHKSDLDDNYIYLIDKKYGNIMNGS